MQQMNQTLVKIGKKVKTPKQLKLISSACILASLTFATVGHAATMSRAESREANNQVSTQYQSAKSACGTTRNNTRDICLKEAKGNYKISMAELEYKDEPTPRHLRSVSIAKADSAFNVAKEKCDDSAGNAQAVCRTEARAAHKVALADAKMIKVVNDAKADDDRVKREGDYKIATEKCETLTGESKATCIVSAKALLSKP
jgi:hypothetical protein